MKDLLGFIGIIMFLAFLLAMTFSEEKTNRNKLIEANKQTVYVKIINKDFRDVSWSMLSQDWQHLLFIERYDIDTNIINYTGKAIRVNEYDYSRLSVGEFYKKDEIPPFYINGHQLGSQN